VPFVSLAVPVPLLGLLTYRVPDGMPVPVRGARVLVPLGQRQVTACVVQADVPAPPGVEVREIAQVIDDEALVPGAVLDLAAWVASYYACGPGEAIAAAMPPAAWLSSERRAALTDEGRARLARVPDADETLEARVLRALAAEGPIGRRALEARVRSDGSDRIVRALERDGLVRRSHVLTGRAAAFRNVRYAALTAQGQEVAAGLLPLPSAREPAPGPRPVAHDRSGPDGRVEPSRPADTRVRLTTTQSDAIGVLRGAPEGLPVSALRGRGIAAGTLTRLASRGLVVFRQERVDRDPFSVQTSIAVPAGDDGPGRRTLTDEQRAALGRLGGMAADGRFQVALLHGVTGSGKTELYLRLAGLTLAAGRRVLVLVPEIALTPAVAAVFRHAFGARVAIQHSGLSDGERHDQWHRIREGAVDIVVGTRSAVFAPLDDIGLVIVDEEHDTSYKQEEAPRYNGRDVAVVRGRAERALVVLGSATPSMETYRNALEGRYALVTLERRVLDRPLAAVSIVNMRDEMAEQGEDVVLSAALVSAIARRVAKGEQALLLLNRRGFATSVFCRQCGATLDCPNCSVSLTVHRGARGPGRARCHYCNHSAPVPTTCARCAAPYLEHVGFGTERVEAEVRRLLPLVRVARVDRDTMHRRGAIQDVLARFAAGEIDLIVGTQMIAKGHDFPAVTLVGVISADVGLGLPDFRASERTFQLLTQVAGRAGRGSVAGEAIVQTLFPEHFSIRLAKQQDYRGFYEQEIRFRKAMRYPPQVALVNVVVRGRAFAGAMSDAGDLAARIRAVPAGDLRVLGPAPAPIDRLRNEYRVQLLLKGTNRVAMREALEQALAHDPEIGRRVTVDVDPVSVM
jgi:primosomal protein N' (replication factor Y)